MFVLLTIVSSAMAISVPEDSRINHTDAPIQLQPVAELGTLAPFSHIIQYGKDGSEFDYIDEGGQDNLFFFSRWSMDVRLPNRHSLTFLYQPLDIRTSVETARDLRFNEATRRYTGIPWGTRVLSLLESISPPSAQKLRR